ncbi:MAG: HEAT repeat domain-containing protein [Thermoguttaceae bacterium]
MKRLKAIAVVSALVAGLTGWASWVWHKQTRRLAPRLAEQLEQAPPDQLDLLLDQVARLDERGITALADALGSRRQDVVERASAALRDQLEWWRTLPGNMAGPRLARLVQALASRVERFGPGGRYQATRLAELVLAWPDDHVCLDPAVLSACERLIRAAAEQDLPDQWQTGPRFYDSSLEPDKPSCVISGLPLGRIAVQPGGRIPVQAGIAAGPGRKQRPQPEQSGRGHPTPPSRAGSEQRHSSSERARPQIEGGGLHGPEQPRRLPVANQPAWLSATRPGERDGRAGAGPLIAAPQTEAAELFELMRQLHSQTPHKAAEAEAELKRRGLSDHHVALARRLFDPDPKTRWELARLLPQVPGLDSTAWLLQLGQDRHSEVRLTALTLLATTGDPRLLEQVRQLARADPDPRVQRLADRLDQLATAARR